MEAIQFVFRFSGRINRAKYWAATLVLLLILSGALAVALALETTGGYAFFFAVLVPAVVSGFAFGVRRLHDRDKSGWWILLFYWLAGALDRVAGRMGEINAATITSTGREPRSRSGDLLKWGACAAPSDPTASGQIRSPGPPRPPAVQSPKRVPIS